MASIEVKNIYILGAGGSIGLQTLDILKHNKDFNLVGLSLSSNDHINEAILSVFKPEIASLRYENQISKYQSKYPDIKWVFGDEGLLEVARYHKPGLLINALSGSSGLMPTVEAIKAAKDIGLANKETLVMAGPIIKDLVIKHGVMLLPIDSEHFALWELLRQVENRDNIKKIAITASGGALRHLSRRDLVNVTKEDALKHPNWEMGPKITIDSATMVNKGLEIIEANHLFGFDYYDIETLLHDESLVHAIVYLKDGTKLMNISKNDMKIPIRKVLYFPYQIEDEPITNISKLTLKPMDEIRYPMISLAYEVGKIGGILPTIYNAANEAAVDLFLKDKITFKEIESIIIRYTLSSDNIKNPTLEDIIRVDKEIKQAIYNYYLGEWHDGNLFT